MFIIDYTLDLEIMETKEKISMSLSSKYLLKCELL